MLLKSACGAAEATGRASADAAVGWLEPRWGVAMAREDVESIDDRGITAWDMHDAKAFAELLADDFVWTDTTMPEPMRTKDQATRISPAC